MPDKTFDALEALSLAVAAYQMNNGYMKVEEYQSIDPTKPARYPNKMIMRAYYNLDHYSADSPRPPLVKITDEHRAKAEEIRNYSKKEIFKVLAKKPVDPSFILGVEIAPTESYPEKLYQLINGDTVREHEFGFVASAPFYYDNGKSRDHIKKVMETIDSKWVGSVGGRVFLERFEVLRCNKSKTYEGYVIQGICDGNLFIYFSGRDCSHIKAGQTMKIRGKVKDHVMEKDTIPMTKLNYVTEEIG